MAKPVEQARAAKTRFLTNFERLGPVVSVARADSRYAVKVNLQAAPPDKTTLPSGVDTVATMLPKAG